MKNKKKLTLNKMRVVSLTKSQQQQVIGKGDTIYMAAQAKQKPMTIYALDF